MNNVETSENNFLLEVLVQELPYRFIPSAIEQLKSAFKDLLAENHLSYDEIKAYATPRRLVVIINGLASAQEDVEKVLKGPILSIATDESGKYTPAALGFAKKNGVAEQALYQEDGYIWARIHQKGKGARDILAQNAENIILKLQGQYFMRWGDLDIKFSRPIENVVALLNDEVLPLTIAQKASDRKTLGHRYSKNKEVEITSPDTYLAQLREANVIADPAERMERIVKLASEKAAEIGTVIRFDEYKELLEEVTYLTEYPVPVLCDFDEKYLTIPDIVTTTVMSKHQRYFPLYGKNGKLLNHFITIANFVDGNEESFNNIKAGNQRVVSARLEDAIFFYKEDTKEPLESKLEALKGITFQKGLGTLYDKTLRVENLAKYLCEKLNHNTKDALHVARLCKCDLATHLVFEFTELQGFIGADYARAGGEKENIALGITEHYFPLGASSELAKGFEGRIVGIADKIDTVCAMFLSTQNDKKKRPTGSADPLGIRRAVLGVLRTIIFCHLNINLSALIKKAITCIAQDFGVDIAPETAAEIEDFFISRLIIMYEKDWRTDVLQSCSKDALHDLASYLRRVEAVSELIKEEDDFIKLSENAVRIVKITNSAPKTEVNEGLFKTGEEKELYNFAKNIKDGDYQALVPELKKLANLVDKFFEHVLVMDKDEAIKQNRLALLGLVDSKFKLLADFSHIIKG